MSRYLDIEYFGEYLRRYGGTESERQKRMVGVEKKHESWYFDIIRFFGGGGVNPRTVKVVCNSTYFPPSDAFILRFNEKIAATLRAEGRLYDGPPVVQIIDTNWLPESASVLIRKLEYADQVAGFAMDLPDEMFQQCGGTLRDYVRRMFPAYGLAHSPLKSGVGVCGMLIVREEDRTGLLKVRRSAKLASLENSVGPSVAGSVEYAEDFRDLAEVIERSMVREVEEELGLTREEFSIHPLAYAREMVRGDRPQLFAAVETKLNSRQIAERINSLHPSAREFSEFEFLELADGRLPESKTAALNFEAKMSYYLLEEWLAG
jgi:hypothetical protein